MSVIQKTVRAIPKEFLKAARKPLVYATAIDRHRHRKYVGDIRHSACQSDIEVNFVGLKVSVQIQKILLFYNINYYCLPPKNYFFIHNIDIEVFRYRTDPISEQSDIRKFLTNIFMFLFMSLYISVSTSTDMDSGTDEAIERTWAF